jgi:hypothetical protein
VPNSSAVGSLWDPVQQRFELGEHGGRQVDDTHPGVRLRRDDEQRSASPVDVLPLERESLPNAQARE